MAGLCHIYGIAYIDRSVDAVREDVTQDINRSKIMIRRKKTNQVTDKNSTTF